ncbi:MAG: universal stress protein [Caldilineaceae bacterium]|nr:universal stress protein [Caldilineaceae bacterium]MCB0126480.1 universal stress protein [Caldilineaceae bacterium]
MNMTNEMIGNRILIAMSNRPDALELVRTVADHLRSPAATHVTLMHYLLPMGWEHGGDDSPAAVAEHKRIEALAAQNEEEAEAQEESNFAKAQAILEAAGVPATQIKTSERWDSTDAAHAVLDELRQGVYTTVVVGEHHHNFLDALFGTSMTEFLQRHVGNKLTVWSIPQAERV